MELFQTEKYTAKSTKEFTSLNFDLVPFALLLAKQFLSGALPQDKPILAENYWYKTFFQNKKKSDSGEFPFTDELLYIFGWDATMSSRAFYKTEVERFLLQEHPFVKKNPHERLVKTNAYSLKEFTDVLTIGAILLLNKVKNPRAYCKKFAKLHKAQYEHFDCRHIARYLLNGWHERDWYKKTRGSLDALFPDKDPRIVTEFFGVTSQNASIEDNVLKTLKALKHLDAGVFTQVDLKLSKVPKKVLSMFGDSYLPAQIKYLNEIANKEFISAGNMYSSKTQKIRHFIKAMLGDKNGFALDFWMHIAFKGLSPEKVNRKTLKTPTAAFYRMTYHYVRLLSRLTKVEPRQIQAAIWVGLRSQKIRRSGQTYYGPLVLNEFKKQQLF